MAIIEIPKGYRVISNGDGYIAQRKTLFSWKTLSFYDDDMKQSGSLADAKSMIQADVTFEEYKKRPWKEVWRSE